jgi:hypothetical protein
VVKVPEFRGPVPPNNNNVQWRSAGGGGGGNKLEQHSLNYESHSPGDE